MEGRCGGCVLDKLSFLNEETTIETGSNFYTNGSFVRNGRNTVKTTAWTIVFVGTAGKRTSSIAACVSVEHKMRGSYKDDRTSDRVDVFSLERGRKKRIKVSSIFLKDTTKNHAKTPFPALTDILYSDSHWTINKQLSTLIFLNTR